MYLKGLFYYYTVHGCFFSYFQKWLPNTDFKALGTVPFVFSLPQMMLRSLNTSIFGHQLVLFHPLPRYWWIGFMTPIYQSKLHIVIDLCCGFGIVNVVHSFNIPGLKHWQTGFMLSYIKCHTVKKQWQTTECKFCKSKIPVLLLNYQIHANRLSFKDSS